MTVFFIVIAPAGARMRHAAAAAQFKGLTMQKLFTSRDIDNNMSAIVAKSQDNRYYVSLVDDDSANVVGVTIYGNLGDAIGYALKLCPPIQRVC